MKELRDFLSQIVQLSTTDLLLFEALFSEKKIKKNEYFAVEGELSSKFAFLSEGIMRAFYRNEKGVEYNKTFFLKKGFVGAYSSLVSGRKNQINLQCLTDCTFLIADYSQVTKLYDTHPRIERFARVLAEQFFINKEKREIELVMFDASRRYQVFQEEYPGLESKIQQYHVASYLGITPTQLSRIRAKK